MRPHRLKVLLAMATLGFWATGVMLASYLVPPASTVVIVATSLAVGGVMVVLLEGPRHWLGRFRSVGGKPTDHGADR